MHLWTCLDSHPAPTYLPAYHAMPLPPFFHPALPRHPQPTPTAHTLHACHPHTHCLHLPACCFPTTPATILHTLPAPFYLPCLTCACHPHAPTLPAPCYPCHHTCTPHISTYLLFLPYPWGSPPTCHRSKLLLTCLLCMAKGRTGWTVAGCRYTCTSSLQFCRRGTLWAVCSLLPSYTCCWHLFMYHIMFVRADRQTDGRTGQGTGGRDLDWGQVGDRMGACLPAAWPPLPTSSLPCPYLYYPSHSLPT